jgi:hypothetical protein
MLAITGKEFLPRHISEQTPLARASRFGQLSCHRGHDLRLGLAAGVSRAQRRHRSRRATGYTDQPREPWYRRTRQLVAAKLGGVDLQRPVDDLRIGRWCGATGRYSA